MASALNHHFVPQYLFRLFNGGSKRIHLMRRHSQQLIYNASVRKQCARHKYYGHPEIETWLAEIDARHAVNTRGILREVWGQSIGGYTRFERHLLLEMVLLQRARVPRTTDESVKNAEHVSFYAFKEHLKGNQREIDAKGLDEAIEKGEVYLDGLELELLTHGIDIATRSVMAIDDLQMVLLRNHTTTPFVFGDCPCVFYNKYLYEVRYRGVLGYRTPGLMCFLPLGERTQLMLYDPAVYELKSHGFHVDITTSPDVSQLNAMQILMANDCVYFGSPSAAADLVPLAAAHQADFDAPRSTFKIHHRDDMLIDGTLSRGELLHTFDNQLPLRLTLSFLETKQIPSWVVPPTDRNWNVGEAIRVQIGGSGGATPIGTIAADVKANLRTRT